MSDSDESGVTYTEVSSPFEGLSDIGSPRADDHEYLELPGMPEDPYVEAALQAPPSPDYVPGPEEPEQAPPSPDYVPGPEHADDEIVAEDQPYAEDASPTAQSPDYVPESDPEADPEEDDDEDPEEDPVDYPADGGDDGDDEEGSSEDDKDDDMDIEADDEEEEEHLAPADSVVVALPATDQASSAEETEPFETDESAATPPPHPAYCVTSRISILAPVPTPVWSDAEVAKLLAISTSPSSALSPWSSPLPQIPSSSLPISPPSPVLSPAQPPSLIRSLGYQATMIRMRAEAASTSHSLPLPPPFILSPTRPDAPSLRIPPPLPISVPTSSPPLLLPSASRREDRLEVTLPPRKRLGIALGPGYEVGESSSAAARLVGGADEDEEEEEHPAPADSVVVALPAADQAPSAEETEPFETDESAATPPPHPAYRVTARISIPAPVPTPVWSDAEVARLLAISTPPSSPLSPWSSPLPQIPSPPLPPIPSPSLPLSPPSPVLSPAPPPSPIRSLGYRAAMIRLRAEAASTSHSLPLPPPFILSPTRSDAPSSGIPPPLPISVPTSSPPLLLPSASYREDRPEVTLPPRKRLGIALGPRYEVGESSSAAATRPAGSLRVDYGFVATMDREIRRDPEREVRYGITDSWDEIVETLQGAPVSTDTELGRHMTTFETRVRQDTDEIYTRLDDEQSQRQLLAGRLNMLFRDRRAHAYIRHLMETEARMSREA
ncbi:hypothetical protein Tco_0547693 [Tanacetum coccineum]